MSSPTLSSRPERSGRRTKTYAFAFVALIGTPVVALTMPESIRIPIAREHGAGAPVDNALFSHWAHAAFTCNSCHPGTFPQHKLGFTHDDMKAGKFCGSCHDGSVAFSPQDRGVSCETCHAERTKREIDENDLWK